MASDPNTVGRPATEGILVRYPDSADIWYVTNDLPRLVPDSPTLESLGGWAEVQLRTGASPGSEDEASGDPMPSTLTSQVLALYPDDSLVTSVQSDEVYVLTGHERRLLGSAVEFRTEPVASMPIYVLSEAEIAAIPLGAPWIDALEGSGLLRVDTGVKKVTSGGYMRTTATLDRSRGRLDAWTRVESSVKLKGYHGAVAVTISDANDMFLASTPVHRWGVDGRWIGTWEREEPWSFDLDPTLAARAERLRVFQSHKAGTLADRIRQLEKTTGPIGPIVTALFGIFF